LLNQSIFVAVKRDMLFKTAIFLIFAAILLSLFIFKISFTALFIFALASVLIILSYLKNLHQSNKYGFKVELLYKIILVIIILGVISFIVVEAILVFNLHQADTEVVTDYLLILGGGVRGETPSAILQDRLDKSVGYLKSNPEVKVIVSGGLGRRAEITEAEAMKRFLVEQGIEAERIIKEEQATSTHQNIKYTKEILTEINSDYEINLLSSDFHIYRAEKIAQAYQLKTHSLRADTDFFVLLNYLIREYFALLKTLVVDI